MANIGAIVANRNIRRTGIPATKRGKPNPEYLRSTVDGVPTAERLAKAQNHFTIGDDRQGTRIYHFHDSALDRLYSRLTRHAKGRAEEDQLRREYTALQKYRHHWFSAGLEPALASVDLNRVFASDPGSLSGMAKTERQVNHRKQYRAAVDKIGWKPHIVLENILCADTSLEVAGFSIGGFNSRTSARDGAERIVRESARELARFWGIS